MRAHDLVNLHDRFFQSKFWNGFEPDQFIAEFDQLMEEYRNMKTEYLEEYKITVFLQKIEGIDVIAPFFSFFTMLETLSEETRMLDYMKHKFSQIARKIIAAKKMASNYIKSKDEKQKDSWASSSGKKGSSLLLSLSVGSSSEG